MNEHKYHKKSSHSALYEFVERKAIDEVLLASEEAKRGEIVRGNADKILGKFMNK